jgi:hypothetical protein
MPTGPKGEKRPAAARVEATGLIPGSSSGLGAGLRGGRFLSLDPGQGHKRLSYLRSYLITEHRFQTTHNVLL